MPARSSLTSVAGTPVLDRLDDVLALLSEPRQLAARRPERGVLFGSQLIQVTRVLVAELCE